MGTKSLQTVISLLPLLFGQESAVTVFVFMGQRVTLAELTNGKPAAAGQPALPGLGLPMTELQAVINELLRLRVLTKAGHATIPGVRQQGATFYALNTAPNEIGVDWSALQLRADQRAACLAEAEKIRAERAAASVPAAPKPPVVTAGQQLAAAIAAKFSAITRLPLLGRGNAPREARIRWDASLSSIQMTARRTLPRATDAEILRAVEAAMLTAFNAVRDADRRVTEPADIAPGVIALLNQAATQPALVQPASQADEPARVAEVRGRARQLLMHSAGIHSAAKLNSIVGKIKDYGGCSPNLRDVLGHLMWHRTQRANNQIPPGAGALANDLDNGLTPPVEFLPPMMCPQCHRLSDSACACDDPQPRAHLPASFDRLFLESQGPLFTSREITRKDEWGVCLTCGATPCQCDVEATKSAMLAWPSVVQELTDNEKTARQLIAGTRIERHGDSLVMLAAPPAYTVLTSFNGQVKRAWASALGVDASELRVTVLPAGVPSA